MVESHSLASDCDANQWKNVLTIPKIIKTRHFFRALRAPIGKTIKKTTTSWNDYRYRWNPAVNWNDCNPIVYGLSGWQHWTYSRCSADLRVLQHGSDCVHGWLDRAHVFALNLLIRCPRMGMRKTPLSIFGYRTQRHRKYSCCTPNQGSGRSENNLPHLRSH